MTWLYHIPVVTEILQKDIIDVSKIHSVVPTFQGHSFSLIKMVLN